MNFASLDDVKRILRISPTSVDDIRDARLEAALEAVEDWATSALKGLGKEGQNVEVYWDRREDETLHLPAGDIVITRVKVYEYPSSSGVPLSPVELGLGHGYDQDDEGRLILRPVLDYSPFEGATAQRRPRRYARVEVFYEGTGVIPRAVTEGVAFLTAGYYSYGPQVLSGITSERIGDYSYTLGGGGSGGDSELPYLAQAKVFLAQYMNRSRIAVV